MKILFDEGSARFVLESINMSVDKEGYIVETSTQKRVLATNGEEIVLGDLAGIIPGSKLFLWKNDANSLLRLYDHMHKAECPIKWS